MDLSWRSGQLQTTPKADTIADGIGVRIPVPEALGLMKTSTDDIVQVSEEALLEAMRLAHRLLGIVLEPSGAAGLAAAMLQRKRFKKQVVATLFCGGNLSDEQRQRWL
jgi:threonine dehydratase